MIHEGQYDPMEDSIHGSVMHNFGGSSTVYKWLLDQEEFYIDFGQTSQSGATIASGLIYSTEMNFYTCLEAVIARGSDVVLGGDSWLAHHAAAYTPSCADNTDYPKRIKVLWDAGVDFHAFSRKYMGTPFGCVLDFALLRTFVAKTKYNICSVVRKPVPKPPTGSTRNTVDYDILDPTLNIRCRPRVSKAVWQTWTTNGKPSLEALSELSILEIAQRHLDAWMEVLLEAGLDIASYGRREEVLHPGGVFVGRKGWAEVRVVFEYGSHVNGCRIHATEAWLFRPQGDDHE